MENAHAKAQEILDLGKCFCFFFVRHKEKYPNLFSSFLLLLSSEEAANDSLKLNRKRPYTESPVGLSYYVCEIIDILGSFGCCLFCLGFFGLILFLVIFVWIHFVSIAGRVPNQKTKRFICSINICASTTGSKTVSSILRNEILQSNLSASQSVFSSSNEKKI